MTVDIGESLATRVRGDVLEPGSPGYDGARRVYNAMVDRRPAVVVRAMDAADAMAAVDFARETSLPLAVRGGGHSVPGYGVCDDGVVLDLSRIRGVRVDPDRRTARVGGGALLGDFDHAAHAYGLATPAGFFSTTGVGGLTLGGGIAAYLGRQHGMTCDNLLSADVITAAGERVVASADRNADLFWALRGGGGNFGVVTSFEFRLHPVDQVIGGPMVFDVDGAADVLRAYDRYIQEAPRELGGFCALDRAPPLPFIPEDVHGEPVCLVVASWNGPAEEADEAFAPIREAGPLVGEHVGPVPYPALQQAFDELAPPGLHHYWKSDWVATLTDESIEAHVEHARRMPPGFSTMHLYPVNGAVHDVDEDATAFAFRDARFAAVIVGATEDPDRADEVTTWVRDYYAAIHPWSGYEGGYTNYASADDEGRVRDNFGSTWERLARIKARWDPDNLFRLNQNIEPAA